MISAPLTDNDVSTAPAVFALSGQLLGVDGDLIEQALRGEAAE
jgi:hypothetical protein